MGSLNAASYGPLPFFDPFSHNYERASKQVFLITEFTKAKILGQRILPFETAQLSLLRMVDNESNICKFTDSAIHSWTKQKIVQIYLNLMHPWAGSKPNTYFLYKHTFQMQHFSNEDNMQKCPWKLYVIKYIIPRILSK